MGSSWQPSRAAPASPEGGPPSAASQVPQGEFAGLDQVNVGPLPRSLAGAGEVNVIVAATETASNTVTIVIGCAS